MRPKTYILLLTVLPALLLFSCNDEKELTIADQEAAIDSYISQNFQDYPVIRRNGSNRRFLSTTDSLIDFYKNGKITIVRQIGSMDDSLAVARGLVRRDSIEIMVRDTLLKGKANVVDSIGIIPFSGGKPIEMDAVVRKVSGINIPLFEARVPYDELLKGLDRQLVVNLKAEKEDMGQYPGLKVGDIENPNNNAGNWE